MSARPPAAAGGLAAVLAATLLTQALATWTMLAFASIAPTIAADLDLSAVLVGYQITIAYLVAAGISLVGGAVVARLGGCRMSQLALGACALGALIATLPHLAAMALASMVIGVAYGLTNPAAAQLLASRTHGANRSFVFSIKQTGVPVGGIMAGLATPWIASTWGWQAAVAATAPLALIVAVLMQPARRQWDGDRVTSIRPGFGVLAPAREVLAQPVLRRLCLCGFCFSAIQLCLMTFVVSLAVIDLSFHPLVAGTLLATAQGGGVVGRLGWGLLADRLQRNDLVLALIGLITAGCCLMLAMLGPQTPSWLVFPLMACFGASALGWNGVFVSEVVRLSPISMAGTAVGVTTFCVFMAVLAGPGLFVHLHAVMGSYVAAFATLSALALAGIVATLSARSATRR